MWGFLCKEFPAAIHCLYILDHLVHFLGAMPALWITERNTSGNSPYSAHKKKLGE